jgi:hypothetical protein
MITVVGEAGSCRMDSVSIKPSTSGMWASVRTSRYGAPAAGPRAVRPARQRRWRPAPVPCASAAGFLQDPAVGGRIIDDQYAQAMQAGGHDHQVVASAGSASSSRTVKWKRLPLPTSLSTHIVPPIRLTSREAIASPSPGSAVPARQGAVALLEHPEDRRLLFRRECRPRCR